MKYQYRWIYAACAAILVMAAGYLIDTKLQLQRYFELVREEKNIRERAAIYHRRMAVESGDARADTLPSDKIFADFFHLLLAAQLKILTAASVEHDEYQLLVSGDFAALMRVLLQENSAYEVKSIEIIPVEMQRVQAEMRVNLTGGLQADKLEIKEIANSFCGAWQASGQRHAAAFSQSDVQVLGTVRQHEKRMKILLQPDGKMREVNENHVDKITMKRV